MNVTILGAGPGGFAFGADLHAMKVNTTIAAYPEHSSRIQSLNGTSLEVKGIMHFAYAPKTTCNVSEAIAHADLILVVVPAFAQERYIKDIIKYGKNSQYVIYVPGYFAGIYMEQLIKKENVGKKFHIAETQTLPFACRFFHENELTIMAKKNNTRISFVENENRKVIEQILKFYPNLVEDSSILRMNIISPGPTVHAPSTILNTSRIEQLGSYQQKNAYEITPSVANVIQTIDEEKKPF